uniref:Uncharacterized protein n=1 Tax=Macrostomum lignano TaxID=282301 RepID=A0A1I8FKZ8_9PLAT
MEVPASASGCRHPTQSLGNIRKKFVERVGGPASANPGPGCVSCYTAYLRSLGHGSVPCSLKLLPQVREFLNHLETSLGDI